MVPVLGFESRDVLGCEYGKALLEMDLDTRRCIYHEFYVKKWKNNGAASTPCSMSKNEKITCEQSALDPPVGSKSNFVPGWICTKSELTRGLAAGLP